MLRGFGRGWRDWWGGRDGRPWVYAKSAMAQTVPLAGRNWRLAGVPADWLGEPIARGKNCPARLTPEP